jgi:hypothetical protein
MSGLSTRDRERLANTVEQLGAVCTMARKNFPSSTEVRISTVGMSPRAEMSISYYEILLLLDLARSALAPVELHSNEAVA